MIAASMFFCPLAYLHGQAVNTTDSLALVSLYNSTNGANWINNANWLTTPVAQWFGVELNNAGTRVVSVDLSANNLLGTLPVLNLSQLSSLSLSSNLLSGNLPALGSASGSPNLQYLDLTANSFSGSISNLGTLPSLVRLMLSSNLLSGSIPSFSGSPQLQMLDLGFNQFSGSLPSFTQSGLQLLLLPNNSLTGTIPNFNLPALEVLDLTANALTGSVPSLSACTHLQNLWLSSNFLTGTFPNFTAFTSLTSLEAYDNRFTFSGLEANAVAFGAAFLYAPQTEIPTSSNGSSLSVQAGGTMANNTYTWYELSSQSPVATIVGNNTYSPTLLGTYYCEITNSQATALTLSSFPINFTPPCNFSVHQVGTSYCNAAQNTLAFDFVVSSTATSAYTIIASVNTFSNVVATGQLSTNNTYTFNLPNTIEAGTAINFSFTSNATGCIKDTSIVNDKCCRIIQEGTLVAVGTIDKVICPTPNITLPTVSCAVQYVITDKTTGVVKGIAPPDSAQCLRTTTLSKYMNTWLLPDGAYRLYSHVDCPGGVPLNVGDVVNCGNYMTVYSETGRLLTRLINMSNDLLTRGVLPLSQPYNGAPWNYKGTESVTSVSSFPATVVDWLLLELRDSSNNNLVVARRAALLLSNGSIADITSNGTVTSGIGSRFISFSNSSNYYVVVRHRNHLPVMSNVALDLSAFVNYNLSLPANIRGGAMQLYNNGGSFYCLRPGDVDANGVITVDDYNLYFSGQNSGTTINVYSDADCDIDGIINTNDFNKWQLNASMIGIPQVRY